MIIDKIVVDMTKSKGAFTKGQAYVAFRRVRTYDGLYLINYYHSQIRISGKVQNSPIRG